jgi:TPR repeat protein
MTFSSRLKLFFLLMIISVAAYLWVGHQYFEKASEKTRWDALQGDPKALFELGRNYCAAPKGEDDFDKGIDLIRAAAMKGYAPAQYDLANHYLLNTRNYKDAYKWLRLAAAQNYKDSKELAETTAKDLSPREMEAVEAELKKPR